MPSRKPKAGPGGSNKSKSSKQPTPDTEESQNDTVSQLLGITIAAINITRDLVPINLAKAILGTVANILTIAQFAKSVIKNKSDFLAIVKKCEIIRKVLERATKDATKDDLQGSLGDALDELNISVNHMNNGEQITAWNNEIDRVLALFHFEVTAGMAIDVKVLKKLVLESKGNGASIYAPKYRPIAPPSRPAMLYGRDNLVAELANLVINDEHIALIGLGGMAQNPSLWSIYHDVSPPSPFPLPVL
ncbi:hypothetical protein P692DRAFT_201873094 [Suillus brevipes Sb2]|nr:hypothetical protein P692DRAFT_201873094 [Suillus brevipes Sb2]